MHEKEPHEPQDHTSEHVKSQNFLEACPQTLVTQSILWTLPFVFALGFPDALGGPGYKLASKSPASRKLHTGYLLQFRSGFYYQLPFLV